MLAKILVAAFTIFQTAVFANEQVISPRRSPDQNWEEALRKSVDEQKLPVKPDSALALSNLEVTDIEGIPEWPLDQTTLETLFAEAKDIRLHENPNDGDYQRKGAWLYPNDGCYSKAAHVSYIARSKEYVQPGKIYAFGKLRFDSPYAENGSTVWWSYHVAAAYHIGETIYVVDPAVSPAGVLTKDAWLALISTDPAEVRLSLCDANSYSPLSTCRGGNGNGAYLGHMNGLLKLEWSNLQNLGHNPDELLRP